MKPKPQSNKSKAKEVTHNHQWMDPADFSMFLPEGGVLQDDCPVCKEYVKNWNEHWIAKAKKNEDGA